MTKTAAPKTVVKPARLTNDMRLSFVAAVMADVPKVDYEQRIRDAVNKAHNAALPGAVKKMLNDPEHSDYVKIGRVTLNDRLAGLPSGNYLSFSLPAPSDEWLKKLAVSVVEPIAKDWVEQEGRLYGLRQKLRTVADSCSTTTKLAEAFPEFARYLPQTDAEGTRNLPALANVVADFVKAGWPKGKRAAA